jgi:hypothetical protein
MDGPGVALRAQLVRAGLTRRTVDAHIAARRWRRLNDDVVALHNGPLTRDQAELAVYLSAPQPAALCGLTAARLWGLRGFDTDEVHIVVRRGSRVLAVPGVKAVVHESRRFDPDDVRTTYAPARVSLERAVIDAAVWSRSVLVASRIPTSAVQQRLTTVQALGEELDGAGRVRHCRVLRLLLNDLGGGAQALSEVEFVRFCRRHRFPKPELNVRSDVTGRRRYLDAVLRLPNGAVVRIEVDGGIHLSLAARANDNRRDNAYLLNRRPVLRFASIDIYTDHPDAVAQIREAIRLVSA